MTFFLFVLVLGWVVCVGSILHHAGVTGEPPHLSDWLIVGVLIELLGFAGLATLSMFTLVT